MRPRRSTLGQLVVMAAAATIGVLFGYATPAPGGAPTPLTPLKTITGRVVGVADGDTLTVLVECEQHRIRLQGIDAPERSQAFGQRSKQHLSDLAFGREVKVHWSKLDPYGRMVGQVILPDGTDVSLAQLQVGLAWFFRRYERELDPPTRQLYTEAEAAARSKKQGLWSDPASAPPWDFRRAQRDSGTS